MGLQWGVVVLNLCKSIKFFDTFDFIKEFGGLQWKCSYPVVFFVGKKKTTQHWLVVNTNVGQFSPINWKSTSIFNPYFSENQLMRIAMRIYFAIFIIDENRLVRTTHDLIRHQI
jgi:hypothetical protein